MRRLLLRGLIRSLLAFAIAASIVPAVFAQSAPPAPGPGAPPELVVYPDLPQALQMDDCRGALYQRRADAGLG